MVITNFKITNYEITNFIITNFIITNFIITTFLTKNFVIINFLLLILSKTCFVKWNTNAGRKNILKGTLKVKSKKEFYSLKKVLNTLCGPNGNGKLLTARWLRFYEQKDCPAP